MGISRDKHPQKPFFDSKVIILFKKVVEVQKMWWHGKCACLWRLRSWVRRHKFFSGSPSLDVRLFNWLGQLKSFFSSSSLLIGVQFVPIGFSLSLPLSFSIGTNHQWKYCIAFSTDDKMVARYIYGSIAEMRMIGLTRNFRQADIFPKV